MECCKTFNLQIVEHGECVVEHDECVVEHGECVVEHGECVVEGRRTWSRRCFY